MKYLRVKPLENGIREFMDSPEMVFYFFQALHGLFTPFGALRACSW